MASGWRPSTSGRSAGTGKHVDRDSAAERGRRGLRPGCGRLADADQKPGNRLDRLLGGRQPDSQQLRAAQRLQTLEREGQVGATFVGRQGVNLVHDHRARGRQHGAA